MSAPDRAQVQALYPSLAALPAALLDQALRPEALLHLPAGAQIFAERQPCQGFPLLLEGTIKVVKTAPSGREMLLYRVEPGESCIITSSCLLGHAPYTARGVAEAPLTLLLLPAPLFDRLVAEYAPFRDFVFHLFSARLAELMELVEEVAFQRLDQRLARLLLAKGADTLIATHQQLAEELGSVREIVSRLLKGFAAQGLVALGREQIAIKDREGLKALAGAVR
ncbi:Crp/Fnr family transcriptional regulator [Azospira inquinata]|uniref:Crp/Fnr family transcriptional regulator n=1 Tax=Azospira inquinata TaxID=2785627 RepID=A0A975SNV0_9RHOO|nr:Crp/Fnr family transcriptional regulator [Azospira inquinata]QWT44888.1 Crp/Fnr family transcriptional regulator [Azospira inquinata]QWT49780.1 Crp/Fnr family transcriptional regulator [Azospira inquinata]